MKMSGKDFKDFYLDKNWWPEEIYHDEAIIRVDGVEAEDFGMELHRLGEQVPDTAEVQLTEGVVLSEDEGKVASPAVAIDAYAKRWLKERDTVRLVVEVSKQQKDTFNKAIAKMRGVKILS